MTEQQRIDFDTPEVPPWPPQERYPLNLKDYDRYVLQMLEQDVKNSSEYLIITAFTSIEYLVDFFAKEDIPQNLLTRVLLGYEPIYRSNRKTWNISSLSDEIVNHWLAKGFSITRCGGVINMIELIKQDKLRFKFSDKLHAKIYVGDTHVMLGSSNMSYAGLSKSKEANVRFSKESQEYSDIKQIAENFYKQAADFKAEILKLLEKLLKVVTWQEALARAISELLEGKWIEEYPESFKRLEGLELWPSQRQAIGQALYVLDSHGSVLVADPTGSGKTKTGASLQLAVYNRFWVSGKGEKSVSWITCPPLVIPNWIYEYELLNTNAPKMLSHHALSTHDDVKRLEVTEGIKKTNILIIDEAHNFLNKTSRRSRSILNSMADHTILFTATPINKKIEDILRLVEILDVDNLSDKSFEAYKKLVVRKSLKSPEEQQQVKDLLTSFTVRRTKKELNRMIDQEPDRYLNRKKMPCRYPEQRNLKYETHESEEDKTLAIEISKLADDLKGLINLQTIEVKERNKLREEEIINYLEQRKKIAKALAKYTIQAMLRSSRIALVEHIEGTDPARKHFGVKKSTKKESGDVLGKLEELKKALPPKNFELGDDWLNDLGKYQEACEQEKQVYVQIANKVKQMSDSRDIGKVDYLYSCLQNHPLVVAFDSKGLTLDYFGEQIKKKYPDIECLVVKGTDKNNKKKAQELNQLGSDKKGLITLCSDSMAEGVNMQQASALVLLDMPSVIRVAEQRIGRVDRMDSPHQLIDIYWPKDSKEFALRTDKKFFRTHTMVKKVLGANIELPEDFVEIDDSEVLDTDSIIDEFEKRHKEDHHWKGIRDAFQSVRELYQGEAAIITENEYNKIKGVEETIRCRVSLIRADVNWGFFAVRGTEHHAPRWFYIEEGAEPESDLAVICEKLRVHLKETENLKWSRQAERTLKYFINEVDKRFINMLPNKKRRALLMFKSPLNRYKGKKDITQERKKIINQLLSIFDPEEDTYLTVDYYAFAQVLLDMIHPILVEKKIKKMGKAIVDVSSLITELSQSPLTDDQLKQLLTNVPATDKIEKRVASCIIGIKP